MRDSPIGRMLIPCCRIMLLADSCGLIWLRDIQTLLFAVAELLPPTPAAVEPLMYGLLRPQILYGLLFLSPVLLSEIRHFKIFRHPLNKRSHSYNGFMSTVT